MKNSRKVTEVILPGSIALLIIEIKNEFFVPVLKIVEVFESFGEYSFSRKTERDLIFEEYNVCVYSITKETSSELWHSVKM